MKIGILTFYWAQDNYGQLLQAYALQHYLEQAGHEAFLIRYNKLKDVKPLYVRLIKVFNPILLYRYLKRKRQEKVLKENWVNHPREFDKFREKYLVFSKREYCNINELQTYPPDADCYIVGSDQVWNFGEDQKNTKFIRSRIHAYFLDFGYKSVYRLSYAASWSVNKIHKNLRAEIYPLLKAFQYVSVREKSGVDLCCQCGRNDAVWVCDPTLLVDAEQYRKIYCQEQVKVPSDLYLFIYMLDNGYEFPLDAVYEWARKRRMKVVFITGNFSLSRREQSYLTIPEWLGYLDGAAAVLTNSFHCAVFATQFRRPFGVVPLVGRNAGMNSRMESLFELCGLDKRYIRETEDLEWLEKPVEPHFTFDRNNLRTILAELENNAHERK